MGFNSGPAALGERMLSMLSASSETQSQENIQEKILKSKFIVAQKQLQCPPEAVQCPITLEMPEKGIFVKNSERSVVCCLFSADNFSRLVKEDLPHPLTREKIMASMIVKTNRCIYDHAKGNFVIKNN